MLSLGLSIFGSHAQTRQHLLLQHGKAERLEPDTRVTKHPHAGSTPDINVGHLRRQPVKVLHHRPVGVPASSDADSDQLTGSSVHLDFRESFSLHEVPCDFVGQICRTDDDGRPVALLQLQSTEGRLSETPGHHGDRFLQPADAAKVTALLRAVGTSVSEGIQRDIVLLDVLGHCFFSEEVVGVCFCCFA